MVYDLDQHNVEELLQVKSVHVTTSCNTAIDTLESEDLVIPEALPVNMLVILRPSSAALPNEKFWLGKFLFCFYFLRLIKMNNRVY